ncbi:L,D-transpeptidase family protein [Microbacterium xanthum]|uniref:L,D-transpeptidase family protein n=1 Tax=Microbacterium xanthum TaxID=3079794 RepID=UPI002AD400E6|nr:L,D-transpeptidase [Microbacterium sp. KSW-48]MDZ8170937.1 L,D-transpeptidase [Microbacterium sp. KSW-48]
MTDVVTRPGSDENTAELDGSPSTPDGTQAAPTEPTYEWAPAEAEPRTRRVGLWAGIGAGIVALGAAAASLVLIAPGTSVAGVDVGFMTQGAAADAIAANLADTTVVLTGDGGGAAITGADLGASIDARGLAETAFAEHPMWKVTSWFADPLPGTIQLDEAVASAALGAAVPAMYTDPVDAEVAFDDESETYVVTPGIDGAGVDVASVHDGLSTAFAAGQATAEIDTVSAPVVPERQTYVAEATAARLNAMLDEAGFYVGDERVVAVEAASLASWITLTPGERGTLDISVDQSAVQKVVDSLPETVNREAVNNKVLVNLAGTTIGGENEGTVGRELETTDGIAAGFSEQVAAANGVYQLPVVETPYETAEVVRLLEVDLSSQMLYLKENDNVVDSWAISSGVSDKPTYTGRYTVHAHVPIQTMRGYETTNGERIYDADGEPVMYETPDVKWIMYFNGDQAFHGVYWHSNWGAPMSHGCVGMPEWRAQQLYNWTAHGTDVWIHD